MEVQATVDLRIQQLSSERSKELTNYASMESARRLLQKLRQGGIDGVVIRPIPKEKPESYSVFVRPADSETATALMAWP
jgi:hypothetical protein